MSLRVGDSTAGVRIDAINEENMTKYFDLLEEVYNELDFKDHPERIYNMDETGMSIDPCPPNRCSGQKPQITVMGVEMQLARQFHHISSLLPIN